MNSNIESHGHHISKQFNLELEEIKNNMLEMGGVIERQIADAMKSLLDGDTGLAAQVLTVEDRIDSMEVSIDEECSLILARRHPQRATCVLCSRSLRLCETLRGSETSLLKSRVWR